jgi:hypothetical protein
VILPVAAKAGAASMEAASRAADIVLNITVSPVGGDLKGSVKITASLDLGCQSNGDALNPP